MSMVDREKTARVVLLFIEVQNEMNQKIRLK